MKIIVIIMVPISTRERGLNIGGRSNMLYIGGYRINRTRPRRRGVTYMITQTDDEFLSGLVS